MDLLGGEELEMFERLKKYLNERGFDLMIDVLPKKKIPNLDGSIGAGQ